MKVLDLDMDYFMTKIASTSYSCHERLTDEDYRKSVWSADEVQRFLEQNLGLSKSRRKPGRIVQGHDEALLFWKELIDCEKLSDPFDVVHVDSHADLGLGDDSYQFLQGKFLTLSTAERRKINEYEFCGEMKRISIGDYLLWAVAYKMISSITYCANPNDTGNDYVWETLKDFCETKIWDKPVKNYIQLKYNKMMEMPRINSSDDYKRKYLEGAIKDPEVELLTISTIEDVKFDGNFDYIVMAQSPNYTPSNADFILDIFRQYINEI